MNSNSNIQESDYIASKINAFKSKRLGKIREIYSGMGRTPIVLHICPEKSFITPDNFNVSTLKEVIGEEQFCRFLLGIGDVMYRDVKSVLEGIEIQGSLDEKANQIVSYIRIYKNGVIEIVGTCIPYQSPHSERKVIKTYEKEIWFFFPEYLEVMKKLGINSTLFVFINLLDVKGLSLPNEREQPFDRDIIEVETVIPLSSFDNPKDMIMPMFDRIWNACGHLKSYA